jgi:predicted Zn-dependent protease
MVINVIVGIFCSHLASGLTVKEEEDLSRQVMNQILKYYPLIDDPVVVEYINNIGNELVAYLPEKLFKYHFYVVKADTFNAFATPAGHIFVHSGLLMAMENEDELAGILSHEIAHVYARHISQKIERSKKIGMATLAGMAAGVLVGAAGGGGEAAEALTMGSMAVGQSAELAYSRENEIQSDQLGIEYLDKAGYSAAGLLQILKKMRSRQWYGSDVVPTYLMTHPAVEERLAYIDSWIAAHPENSRPPSTQKNEKFQRVHTMVLTRYGDEKIVLANLEAAVKANPQDSQAHYRYGLILARVGQREEGIRQIKIALEKKAFDTDILTELGRIYYLDGQYQKALAILKSVHSMKPDDPECILFLGRTHLEMGQPKAASDYFLSLVEKYPRYKHGYYFLGQSLGKEGDLGNAHYYLGIFNLIEQDFKSASVHFKRALKHTEDSGRREEIEKILAKLNPPKSKKKE